MEWGCLKTSFWSDILKNVVVRAKKPKKRQSLKSLVLRLLHKPLEDLGGSNFFLIDLNFFV